MLAIDMFNYRIKKYIGSYAAAMGGIDALVFTGGIGEHAAPVRDKVVRGASWLGLELDEAANLGRASRITTARSRLPAYVVPTDEELMIARHVRALLG